MKTLSMVYRFSRTAILSVVLTLIFSIIYDSHAANDYWAGVPHVSATTNWSDAANWTGAVQTYYNRVEFTGVGATTGTNISVNNVLDSTTGVAQMPIWELDYIPTNANYTTLIQPGITLSLGAGRGDLAVGADVLNTGNNPAPANSVETITIEGTGATLSMVGNLWVSQSSPTPGDTHNVTLDLSGLDNFIDNGGPGSSSEILVATGGEGGVTGGANGTLYLAKTNTISLGDGFQICNQSSGNSVPCAVYLGLANSILTGTGNLIVGGPGTTTIGAWMKFNPAFLGSANPPVAYFAGNGGSGRIANFWICDANGGPQVAGYGFCDFSGGQVTMYVSTMQLGQAGNVGADAHGMLTFDNGLIDVNNATIGNQEVSGGGIGVGVINLNSNTTYGASATLRVNDTLTLAAVSGTLTPGTAGTININGGALVANDIVSGGGSSSINVTNGTLTLSGTAGTPASPVGRLTMANSTLNLAVEAASTNIVVSALTTAGTTNIINITAVPVFPRYPTQITLIKYPTSIDGAGYNFGLGMLPALCAGYLSNNTANASVDLVLSSGPMLETWTGAVSGNWDTTTANWLADGSPATYADGDSVQFLDGANDNTVNLTTTLMPNSITVSNTSPNYTFNGSGQLSGATGLLKQGAGTLVIDSSGSNNFSGGVTINAGTLQVGNNDTSGNLPAGRVLDNGTLAFNRTDNITVNSTISGSGSLIQEGASGTLQLSGANTFSGAVVVTNGSMLKLGSRTALGTGSNTVTITSGSTLDADGYSATKPLIVSGAGVDGSGAIINSGAAIYDNPGPGLATNIILAGDTTFTINSPNRWDLGSANGGSILGAMGAYNLALNGNGGYFEWRNLSVQPPLANITIASGNLGVVGTTTFGDPSATLVVTPGATLTLYGPNVLVNKHVDLQNGATIDNAYGVNVMDGGMTLEAGYETFNVGGGTTLTLSNVLSGSGVFYQNGGMGTAVLDGNSPAFTGGVDLYSGQLVLNGLIGSGIISQSGTTLSGTGTADGLVDVSGILLPGGNGAAGTFNAAGGLTLESGATVTMNLSSTVGPGGPNALVVVTGNLIANGNNIVVNPINGFLSDGTYTLFTYSGLLSGLFGAASTIAPSRYTFTVDTNTPGQVNLIVSGQGDMLEWNNGGNNGLWDVATSYNWTNLTTHSNDQFLVPDTVLLDDNITNAATPTTSLVIPLGVTVAPSLLINNSTTNYSISGPGKISGGASIVKLGPSTLTITATNDFTGNVTIGAGAIQINGVTAALGSPNGTLTISNGAGVIVNLSGSYPPGDAGFGNKPIIVSGAGVNGKGAIQIIGHPLYDDNSTLGLGQNITLTGNTTIGGNQRWDWGYPGLGSTLSSGGSNYNLTVIETGYSQWQSLQIDTNLGNIDIYQSQNSRQTWRVSGMGVSLGNPTNVLTLHSNVLMNIVHGDTTAGDNGYAKIVHILPTAVWQYQPSGGAGDYRLNTSFVLESNAGLYFFSGNGGNNSGTVINGAVTLNGLANFQIGNSPVTFSNVITGVGGFYLNQYGGYPLVFAATNTYQGITDIRSGMVLALVGNGSIADSTNISLASGATLAVTNRTDGTLTLASGQTLTGAGIVQGNLVAEPGSIIAPGANGVIPTATLTISSNVTLHGNTLMKLSDSANDVLSVGGALTYGGTLTLTNIAATPLVSGENFALFRAATYNGSFTTITPATPGAGLLWNTSNLAVNGTIGVVSAATLAPRITGISLSGTTLTVQGTNGTPNGQYVLLQSTNLTQPLSQWAPALTNSFDAHGDLNLSTNIVNLNNPQEFYILRTQ